MLAVVPALARAPRVGLLPQALRSLPEQRLDLRSQRVDVERGERRGDLAADIVLGERRMELLKPTGSMPFAVLVLGGGDPAVFDCLEDDGLAQTGGRCGRCEGVGHTHTLTGYW